MQSEILEGPQDLGWTYDLLAAVVYDRSQPTRSQLSAVARAVQRLAEHAHVRIEPSSWDARVNIVRHADPIEHVERILLALPAGSGFSYEALASNVYWNPWPTRSEISATARAVDQLVEQGRARVLNASEEAAGRPYISAIRTSRSR